MKITCCQCGESHEYSENEVIIDYSGFGYTAKLVRCQSCGQINIVKFDEDENLNTNSDKRYYL